MNQTDSPMIQSLLRKEAYDHPVRQFELLETHISWVILTGDYAYKLKKPVDYGFVDFTTLEKRRFCCDEELRLNRRQSHDLYLTVKPVYGPREQARFHGTGTPIDFAVQMRQFSQSELLPAVLTRGELTVAALDQLASDVATFQHATAVSTDNDQYGSNTVIRQVMEANFTVIQAAGTHPDLVQSLLDWSVQEFARREADFVNRKANGMVREGHGDMHLGNMIQRQGRIEVFDCLEFNANLRWIDVVSEVAFLVMDLADRGHPELGWRFLNEWLEHTGDYAGLRVWAWYFCYRALVRAKVAVLRHRQSDVTPEEGEKLDQQLHEYLVLAQSVTQRPAPRLYITHGLSGSGKSCGAQQAAAEIGLIRLRSDVERKRLFGVTEDPPRCVGELYSADATRQTYDQLRTMAADILRSGWSVIIDATCLRRSQRQVFRELADELGVPARLIAFQAEEGTLRQRITERQAQGTDASDATPDVLQLQQAQLEPIQPDERWEVLTVPTDLPDAFPKMIAALRLIH